MGFYTYFGCRRGVLKPEVTNWLNNCLELRDWSLSPIPEIQKFANVSRANMIPYGSSIMFSAHSVLDAAKGVWRFGCSLKNYESTIEAFMELVVPHIFKSAEFLILREDYEEFGYEITEDSWEYYPPKEEFGADEK